MTIESLDGTASTDTPVAVGKVLVFGGAARKESSAVLRLPVCKVGNRGFLGEGCGMSGRGTGEGEFERLAAVDDDEAVAVEFGLKKPSIPR